MPGGTKRQSRKKFDATLKHLLEAYPADWIAPLGLPFTGQVEAIEADLSTVTALADKVLRVLGPEVWLLHIELQASRAPLLARRTLKYNVLLYDRHGIPVYSVIVLLRPEADDSSLTGTLSYPSPDGGRALEFHYQVVRLWQQPVESILTGGVGSLPLALLCNVNRESLSGILHQVVERYEQELPPLEAQTMLTATYLLAGLRYAPDRVSELFEGVPGMKESSTYQAILKEGEVTGARKILLRMGKRRFGPPTAETRQALDTIMDLRRLDQLADRVLEVESWDELLRA